MRSAASTFFILSGEALADATRRRITPVVAVVSVLSLMAVDGCTGCASSFVENGQEIDPTQIAGYSGTLLFTVLALWTCVLAGILASDHLIEPLADGSAALILGRPVGRSAFALARLAGVLAITFVTGLTLLGVTAFLLSARHDLPIDASVLAGVAAAVGWVIVAALSMLASLLLPRIAVAMLVLVGVGSIASVNLVAQLGGTLTGLPFLIDQWGPPLASAVIAALSPWIAPAQAFGSGTELALRLSAWAIGSSAALLVAVRRIEIGR